MMKRKKTILYKHAPVTGGYTCIIRIVCVTAAYDRSSDNLSLNVTYSIADTLFLPTYVYYPNVELPPADLSTGQLQELINVTQKLWE